MMVDDCSHVSSVSILGHFVMKERRPFSFANVNFGCSHFLFRSILQEAVLADYLSFTGTCLQTSHKWKKRNCLNDWEESNGKIGKSKIRFSLRTVVFLGMYN